MDSIINKKQTKIMAFLNINKNEKKSLTNHPFTKQSSSRNFSGVPRRLLDGSNRQISSIALNATSTMSSTSNNILMNSSSSPYGTLSSIKSTHSSSSSSNGSHSSGSSVSNNLITFQCNSVDTVDGLPSASATASVSSCSSFAGNATTAAAAAAAVVAAQQQQQQHQHQQHQSLVSSPASGGGGCSSVGIMTATAATAICGGGVAGSGGGIVVLNSNSGGNSPRLGDAALSSLAASPTDACSMRSNPSTASLMANDMQGGSIASSICGAIGNTATLSPLSSAAAHHLIRRPSITMCVYVPFVSFFCLPFKTQ